MILIQILEINYFLFVNRVIEKEKKNSKIIKIDFFFVRIYQILIIKKDIFINSIKFF